MKRTLNGDREAQARFRREGEVQARLRHNNVAALLAIGMTKRDEPYLAVELLRGKTLRGVIKAEGKVAPLRAASYAYQALQGLGAVHAAGVLHRDLKPANIMLEPSRGPVDRVVLIDFGFASFEGSTKLTLQGAVVGSLTYIAPERLRGEPPDQRSDLYAIGVILFELLTGVAPFVADHDLDLIEMHLHSAPSPCATPTCRCPRRSTRCSRARSRSARTIATRTRRRWRRRALDARAGVAVKAVIGVRSAECERL